MFLDVEHITLTMGVLETFTAKFSVMFNTEKFDDFPCVVRAAIS
jgi:hypothetical protein